MRRSKNRQHTGLLMSAFYRRSRDRIVPLPRFRFKCGAPGRELPTSSLMIADDMGYRDYGFMGHRQIQTPRLDRLARESLTFRRGYVTSSLCSPSLASILTGRYPHQHKITSNDPPLPRGVPRRRRRAASGVPGFAAGDDPLF